MPRRLIVASLPWLAWGVVLAPRGMTALRGAFWRPLTTELQED